MKYIVPAVFLLITSCIPLNAEVFLLGPGRGEILLSQRLPGMENAVPLYSKKVLVNGKSFTMRFFPVSSRFEDMLSFVSRASGGKVIDPGKDTIRCKVRLQDGSMERILLVRPPSHGQGGATVITLSGSPGLPPAVWHRDLPELPSGAKAVQVIEVPEDGSVCGMFDFPGGADVGGMFGRVDAALRSSGFIPLGNEGSPLVRGNGDVYHHPKKRQMVWVHTTPAGGAFYCRKGSL